MNLSQLGERAKQFFRSNKGKIADGVRDNRGKIEKGINSAENFAAQKLGDKRRGSVHGFANKARQMVDRMDNGKADGGSTTPPSTPKTP